MSEEKKYPPVTPHGGLKKVLDNVYSLEGTFPMAPGVRTGRSMTIVKRGDELTILNSIRVDDSTLEEIKKLGTIQNVVRLGNMHGADDPFYVDTFQATFWQPQGLKDAPPAGLTHDKSLTNDGEKPISDMKFMTFQNAPSNDSVVWIPDNGGTVICCDVLQNTCGPLPHCNLPGRVMTSLMGFRGECRCVPVWRYAKCGSNHLESAEELLAWDWDNLFSGHGQPKIGGAKAIAEQNMRAVFKK